MLRMDITDGLLVWIDDKHQNTPIEELDAPLLVLDSVVGRQSTIAFEVQIVPSDGVPYNTYQFGSLKEALLNFIERMDTFYTETKG